MRWVVAMASCQSASAAGDSPAIWLRTKPCKPLKGFLRAVNEMRGDGADGGGFGGLEEFLIGLEEALGLAGDFTEGEGEGGGENGAGGGKRCQT